MTHEEPSYLGFARAAVRYNESVSAAVARELVARIDRDASALKAMQPRKVTTFKGLTELPEGTVLRDNSGDVFQRRGGEWCGYECSPLSDKHLSKYLPVEVLA